MKDLIEGIYRNVADNHLSKYQALTLIKGLYENKASMPQVFQDKLDKASWDGLTYLPQWEEQPAPLSEKREGYPKVILIVYLESTQQFDKTVLNYYSQNHPEARVIQIRLDDQTEQVSENVWRCDVADPGGFETCLRAYPPIDAFLFIAVDGKSRPMNEIQLLRLVKFLKQRLEPDKFIDSYILTLDNYRIQGTPKNPYGGGITGLAYSIAQGDHRFLVRNIDMSHEDLENSTHKEALLEKIIHEPASHRGAVIKYQSGSRYGQVFLKFDLGHLRNAASLKKGGVYVILGGSGVVGGIITSYMIRDYQARVVWIGRGSETSPVVREKLASFNELGMTPLYIQGDATRLDSMKRAVNSIRRTFSTINGAVFSGAVFNHENSVDQTTETEFEEILDIKTRGSVNFYRAFQEESLDFMCYFSSVQSFSFLSAKDSSGYAAGITYSDAFVNSMAQNAPFPVGVINWGYWEASTIGTVLEKRLAGHYGLISDDHGCQFFKNFISSLRKGISINQVLCLKASENVRKIMKCPEDETLFVCEQSAHSLAAHLLENPDFMKEEVDALVKNHHPEEFNRWMLQLLFVQMRRLGIFPDQKRSREEWPALRKQVGIINKYERWWHECCLGILETDGYLRWEDRPVNVREDIPLIEDKKAWKEFFLKDPEMRAKASLVDDCLKRLPGILRGTIQATDVIFPNSSMEKVEKLYKDNGIADYFNTVIAELVKEYVKQRIEADPGALIRIIEIGAGVGGTTAIVLPRLRPFQDHIEEYCYTDISMAFSKYARQHYKPDYPYIAPKLWNIEHPLADQEIDIGTYDIAIATNVLHATKEIRATLRNVKAALKRKGVLILNEVIEKTIFGTLTFGLLDGWWRYKDEELRIPGSPLLHVDTWRKVLKEEGFCSIMFPAKRAGVLGQQVIVSESNGVVRRNIANSMVREQTANAGNEDHSKAISNDTAETVSSETAAGHKEYVTGLILGSLSQSLDVPENDIDLDVSFSDYGLDSILGVRFVDEVNEALGIPMNTAIIYNYTTVARLTNHVMAAYKDKINLKNHFRIRGVESENPEKMQHPQKRKSGSSGFKMDKKREHKPEDLSTKPTELAVIGMSGQFPGAGDVDTFWKNLCEGHDGIRKLTSKYLGPEDLPGNAGYKWGGTLAERACFDPLFFNISPREAEAMNPHQRLILQESWKGLEDAGYNPRSLENTRVGIFIGAEPSNYARETLTGASDALIASRLSYYLNLTGPAMVVNTGCSSSGTAIHLACDSLRNRESNIAVAGGVFAVMDQTILTPLLAVGMLSPTGQCHSFDESGNGMVLSEGVGIVVLKRLSDAIAAGDSIYGVIRGSGVNQDGASNGITAPNGAAQETLIADVYERYRVHPEEITYIETHGTGTKLGDPVEANALVQAFKKFTNNRHYCAIGSAKSHIGHTAASAGVIGLIKILLSLKYRKIPGLLHFKQLNPLIEFKDSPFYVNTQLAEWRSDNQQPLTAALNSFGHSGTNVHMVVQEYVEKTEGRGRRAEGREQRAEGNGPYLIVLSAKNEARLKAYAQSMLEYIKSVLEKEIENRKSKIENIAYTLQVGREAMTSRAAFVATNISELADGLKTFMEGKKSIGNCWNGHIGKNKRRIQIFDSDEDAKEMVAKWIAKGKLGNVAELWVQGIAIDWDLIYGAVKPRRISLPTYSFAKNHYWLEPKESVGKSGIHRSEEEKIAFRRSGSVETTLVPGPGVSRVGLIMMTPVWNPFSILEENTLFPPVTDPAVIVGGTMDQRKAVREVYPDAQPLEIHCGDTVEAIGTQLNAMARLDHIIWIAPDHPLKSPAKDVPVREHPPGALHLFRMVKAMLSSGYGLKDLRWTLITTQAQAVRNREPVNPGHASIHGFTGSMAKEYPHWKIRLLDLEADRDWPLPEMFSLPFDPQGDALVHRGKEWFKQSLIFIQKLPGEQPPANGPESLYRTKGVYVVIGGAGGIGAAWTRYMIEKYQARIIWIGRRKKDAEIQAKLDSISQSGPIPTYIQADARDLKSLQKAYDQIKETHDQIHGVIHSAIVLSDKSLANMDEAQFQAGLQAKVDVCVRLAQVFQKEPLDLVLFFSAMQSFVKAPGQSNYAAGCVFKDAFARQLAREWSCSVKVMNWGYWGSVGAVTDAAYRDRMARAGQGSIEPEEAMGPLEFLLHGPREQMALIKTQRPQAIEGLHDNEWMTIYPDTIPSLVGALHEHLKGQDTQAAEMKSNLLKGLPNAAMEALLLKLLRGYFQLLGLPTETKPKTDLPDYYNRWLEESVRLLLDRGFLRFDQDRRAVTGPAIDLESLWKEWEQVAIGWKENPRLQAVVHLPEACLRALPDILAGKQPATDILFPDASIELVEGIYKGNVVADLFNEILNDTVVAYLQKRLSQDPSAQIRILEIGAGTGGTTAGLLPKLHPFQGHIHEYCYTDISRAFLIHGEELFGRQNSYFTTEIFDVGEPIAIQNIEANHYDLVIASNVLHATKNIRETLRNAKAALRKHGLLVLNEISDKSVFTHLTFGLLEGWWLYEDTGIRIPGSPGLYPETWAEVLAEEGFGSVSFPAKSIHASGQQIIVAESDGVVRQKYEEIKETSQEPDKETAVSTSEARGKDIGKHIADTIIDSLSRALKISKDDIDHDVPFSEYGVDSILGVSFIKQVNDRLEISMNTTILFDHTTVDSLTNHILSVYGDQIKTDRKDFGAPVKPPLEKAFNPPSRERVRGKTGAVRRRLQSGPGQRPGKQVSYTTRQVPGDPSRSSAIAVIGMSGQFPGAGDINAFWRNLIEGKDAVCDLPSHYLDKEKCFSPINQPGKTYCRWGGILEERDCFDPLFFNIAPREAVSMNPHQRLILQETWKGLEDAGYNPKKLEKSQVSLFIGAEPTGYLHESFTGASEAIVASRLSYYLNLKGAAIVVNTGCSSSGVAIHLACENLRHGESNIAMAGGVFAVMNQRMLVSLSQTEILSRAGKCHTFDSAADGTVFSEGIGIVVLKRLDDAIDAGDSIYGVIQGSGVNQDGASNGITAPNGSAQEALITDVYKRFRINPGEITYVEAHGTGTKLGDPVEANALVRAFKQFTDTRHYCAIGSAKAHIGHTGASSGVVGLIKILLSLKHHQIPGLLHFKQLNPLIEFKDSPFYINTESMEWRAEGNRPLMAALSSFGHSGTNAHIVVKEYIPQQQVSDSIVIPDKALLIPFSAKNQEGLTAYAEKLLDFITSTLSLEPSAFSLSDIAYTLQTGREAMKERAVFLTRSISELKDQLKAFTMGKASIDDFWKGHVDENKSMVHVFDAEEETQELFDKWLAGGKLRKVARFWAQGVTMNWDLLYGGEKPRRIHLPTYPFAKEHYWASDTDVKTGGAIALVPIASETLMCNFVWKEKAVPSKINHPEYSKHLVILGDVPFLPEAVEPNTAGVNWIRLQSREKTLENRFEDFAIQVFETIRNLLEASHRGEMIVQLLIPGHGPGRFLSGLSGLLKTAHLENPKFTGQVIELDGEETEEGLLRKLRENSRCPEDSHIRYRKNQRQTLTPAEIPMHKDPLRIPWKDGGIYLITGGAGGLGSIFTREIALKCNGPKLILTGRSPLTLEKEDLFKAFESLGAGVDYRQVDVSRKKAVEDLIKGIQEDFGGLHGIIHSAGVIKDNFILKKEPAEFKAVFAPKVAGTVILDQATRDLNLDFFVLFSAGAAVTGNPGQADYSTANAFMDAYALYRNDLVVSKERQGRTLSINWPLWKEGGMGVDRETEEDMRQNTGMAPMETASGIQALIQAMASTQSRVMVLEGNPARLRKFLFEDKSKSKARLLKRSIPKTDIRERTLFRLKSLFGEIIELSADRIESREPLANYGIDSIMITKLNRKLETIFGEIPKTLFYEYQTLNDLADYFIAQYPRENIAWTAPEEAEASPEIPPEKILPSQETPQVLPVEKNRMPGEQEPIAIIGIAGHYPMADTIEAFWENLKAGKDCITEIPPKRWPLTEFYEEDPEKALNQAKSYSKRGGFLEGFSDFDPLFFNITPADVFNMDPQERLMLTTCWEAMEDSGYSRQSIHERYEGSVGVFIGVTKSGFNLHTRMGPTLETSRLPCTSFSSMANRVSYHLNLSGPSMAIDTMCSSSITAIHEACEHIRRGDCRLAFAGAVNLYPHPRTYLDLCLAKVITDEPEIHCFSKTGKGFIPGEGVGAALLKPLDQAVRDGDHIEGVILGSGINHGGQTNGYTVPNPARQRELIRVVLQRAGCDANTIDYIESAANGSAMGDAIEFEALRGAFQSRKGPRCHMGSLKPNIGHAEAASGFAQLTKVLCQMKYRTLAPTRIDTERLDKALKWDQSPFQLVTETITRPGSDEPDPEGTHTVLITSSGAGGSYAAMVVREYRKPGPVSSRNPQLILLSARKETQLKTYAKHLRTYLEKAKVSLPSLAYTLQQGRDPMRFRLAIIAKDQEALTGYLDAYSLNRESVKIKTGDSRQYQTMRQYLTLREIEDRVAKALANGDLESLTDYWLKGYDHIGWDKLYDGKATRCSLPTYPFEKRAFWFEGVDSGALYAQDQKVQTGISPLGDGGGSQSSETGNQQQIQEKLIEIIKDVLFLSKTDELDKEDTFSDLGLDSINVVRFIQKLSKQLDLPLRETLVFDYPTIGALADYIAFENPQPVQALQVVATKDEKGGDARFKEHVGRLMRIYEEIVPLQTEGEGPVLFCIHPMSGDVGLYKALAEAARKRFRVIGIKARGFLTDKQPFTTMEEMGRYYAKIITAFDPEGPFHLFGSSMGGTAAYETTRCLRLQDKTVKTLLLGESPLIETDRDARLWDIDEKHNWIMNANFLMITMLHLDPDFRQRKREDRIQWSELEITEDALKDVTEETVVDSLVTLIKGRGVKQAKAVLRRRLISMAGVHLANLRALRRYRAPHLPESENLKALLFSTRTAIPVSEAFYNPDYLVRVQKNKGSMSHFFKGWKRVLPQLETEAVHGENHFDLLSAETTVQELAESIAKAMDRSAPKPIKPGQTFLGHTIDRKVAMDRKVAIVGMSGQFPGGETLNDFWRLLTKGQSAFKKFPKNRYWNQGEIREKAYIRQGAFLEDIDAFDPLFFRIPPKEAEMMDPSERFFLQESWRAIEDAGLDPLRLSREPWGVFCGGGGDYTLQLKEILGVSPHVTPSSIPGRVSYSLNLTGPCLTVDAGCASSLMAIAQACDHLIFGKCDVAIAGGILIYSTPNLIITGCRNRLFSEDGQSRAFDAKADGMTPGEGVGVLILKPLENALADKDRIHGVIEGWGSNHNGKTNGMAAPSVVAQAALLMDIYNRFQINPETISMVEANATGTPLGDTMEVQALTATFRRFTEKKRYCALGSVENNVGHAFQGSGMAHMMKVLLAMRHEEIPGTLNIETVNPTLDLDDSPFFINTQGIAWNGKGEIKGPRRATVSSFGSTGINVHLVIAEPPAPPARVARHFPNADPGSFKEGSDPMEEPEIIVLSAKTKTALRKRCEALKEFMENQEDEKTPSLANVSANLLLRRSHFSERCAMVVSDRKELDVQLSKIINEAGALIASENGFFIGSVQKKASPSASELGKAAIDAIRNKKRQVKEELLVLADLYVKGVTLDLRGCFSEAERFPLSLPTYPFEKRHCRLKEPEAAGEKPENDSPLATIQKFVTEITGYKAHEIALDEPLNRFGLDSLMSMRLLAMINERFSLSFQLADLLDHNSVKSLASAVKNEASATQGYPGKKKASPFAMPGQAHWFSNRLATLPEDLRFASFENEHIAARKSSPEVIESGRQRLAALIQKGIAIFNEGTKCHFLSHCSVDLQAVLNTLSLEQRRDLLTQLPVKALVAPVSQEQERNLYHSEVMKQAAWNIQHVYELTSGSLDFSLLNEAMAQVVTNHDVLRTDYIELGEGTWGQIIAPEARLQFQVMDMPGLPEFQRFVETERSRLLNPGKGPLLQAWVSRIDQKYYIGFVTHHSLADAFTTTMLISELMSYYHLLLKGQRPVLRPVAEQYWLYTLRQFDKTIYGKEKTRRYWRDQLADRPMSMKLPYAQDPNKIEAHLLQATGGHIISLSASLGEAIKGFNQEYDITHTQLFLSAITMMLVHGMGNTDAVIHFINNQRDRTSLMNTLGEFTNVLFLPFGSKETACDLSVIKMLRKVKEKMLKSLGHAKMDFHELLSLTGLGGYDNYYRQTGDVMVDSADIDTGTLGSFHAYGRSLFADTLFRQKGSFPEDMEGQALATLFYQILKVENNKMHLIKCYSCKELFERHELEPSAKFPYHNTLCRNCWYCSI